jgi:hypothetical protein
MLVVKSSYEDSGRGKGSFLYELGVYAVGLPLKYVLF